MNYQSEASCGCDKYAVDFDGYGYATEWEDPSFVGKGCLWHKHIRGPKGIISPDVDSGQPAIFVQLKDRSFTAPLSELCSWARQIGAKRK